MVSVNQLYSTKMTSILTIRRIHKVSTMMLVLVVLQEASTNIDPPLLRPRGFVVVHARCISRAGAGSGPSTCSWTLGRSWRSCGAASRRSLCAALGVAFRAARRELLSRKTYGGGATSSVNLSGGGGPGFDNCEMGEPPGT